jgi:acyl-CoA synthetase (AMP-forming)/AMP-acid ligase II
MMNSPSPYDGLTHLTVWGLLEKTAQRLPDKTAFVAGEERLTYSDLLRRSGQLAAGMAKLGFRRGDMAAMYMPNSMGLVTTFYALQKLGVAVVWINPAYREKEASYILKDSRAKAVFAFEAWQDFGHLNALRSLQSELPHLEHIIITSPGSKAPPDAPSVRLLSDLVADEVGEQSTVEPDDLSMLLYTSGTTGKPKGAMIGQSQVVRAGKSYALIVDAEEDDVFLAFLPMGHSYGCGALLVQPVVLGATAVIMESFRPSAAFKLIQDERITLQPGAPAHYLMELSSPDRQNYDLSSLRAGMIAGQIAPAGLIRRVEEEMGMYISSFLGSSEVGPGNSILLPYGSSIEDRETSIGKPIPGTQIKIVDPVTAKELPDGEAGELLLSGWHVMQGYWDKPEETRNQLKDGWLHTGDLAARDERGNVRILGRLKEWINRGGFKIIPSELEALLVDHPNVAEACVVNTPNPILGESICACVKLNDPTSALTLDDVREFLDGKVAKFKLPDELVVMEDFPRMPGGLKVNRFGSGGMIELAESDPKKQTLHPA